jgi:regulator of protease activity HflC (stomatin/prohibitin superfamily)
MAGKIFINYRRDDSISTAGRLHDRLAQTFGRNNLFMDVDHIPAGVDFVEYLHSQVAACDVFLAVIGPNWLDARDDSGRRRFDNPDDFVAIEIAAALARNIRVIPVLVARTPKADTLPDAVKPLVRRNAVEVRNTHFGRDAEALTSKVGDALKRPVTRQWPFMASAAARLAQMPKPLPGLKRGQRLVIYLMVATVVAVVLYSQMLVTVPSGEVGVLWNRFGAGTVLDPRRLKDEGFNLILPWNRVFLYDLKLQSITEYFKAISSDGVSLTATILVRFRLKRDAVPVLHQAIGPNYEQVLVEPGIGSLTREVIAQYTAEQVYSTARQEIQDKIRSLVEDRISEKMMEYEGEESYRVSMRDTIIFYDILVTGIELPRPK